MTRRNAERDYVWIHAWRIRRLAKRVKHGTMYAYNHHRCRCARCRLCRHDYWLERRIRVSPEERVADGRQWQDVA